MHVIRPVALSDIDSLEKCAKCAGLGLTHLPKQRHMLEKKIQDSCSAFAKEVVNPKHEDYFFVLSDTTTKEVQGTCAIYSKVGAKYPFDVFAIEILNGRKVLRLKQYRNGPSEIGALYLLPENRGSGLGRLLSLSRLLFIASHLQRFEDIVIANMRGVIDNGNSKFYDAIAAHIFKKEFTALMAERLIDEKCVQGMLPTQPIFVDELPKDAQEVIGTVHPHTQPAINMLLHEGFQHINEIDPFDGGPIIQAITRDLKTVKSSLLTQVKAVTSKPFNGEQAIICNERLDFRACFGTVTCGTEGLATISSDVAEALEVQPGDTIRYIAT